MIPSFYCACTHPKKVIHSAQ